MVIDALLTTICGNASEIRGNVPLLPSKLIIINTQNKRWALFTVKMKSVRQQCVQV